MADAILPQLPTAAEAEVTSVEWLFEPAWSGERLIARAREGGVHLTDASGRTVDDDYPEAIEVLRAAILADSAVVDGVWTSQPFVGDGSPARTWAETLEREGLEGELPDPVATERRRAFVALDLVELDGERLDEVPFQERRRLLESVIEADVRVRLSPTVKPPVEGWLTGWRANGFTHYLAKHQNSRYRPGQVAPDWLEIPLDAPSAPHGFVGRLLRPGGRASRRITDSD